MALKPFYNKKYHLGMKSDDLKNGLQILEKFPKLTPESSGSIFFIVGDGEHDPNIIATQFNELFTPQTVPYYFVEDTENPGTYHIDSCDSTYDDLLELIYSGVGIIAEIHIDGSSGILCSTGNVFPVFSDNNSMPDGIMALFVRPGHPYEFFHILHKRNNRLLSDFSSV